MKTTASKTALFIILALVAAPTGLALAGQKQSAEVLINDTLTRAMGSLGSARNSVDLNQYIGCTVYNFSNGNASVICTARDSFNTTRTCTTNVSMAPTIIEAARHITTDSYIFFKWSPVGDCTELHVTNTSQFAPKK